MNIILTLIYSCLFLDIVEKMKFEIYVNINIYNLTSLVELKITQDSMESYFSHFGLREKKKFLKLCITLKIINGSLVLKRT